MAGHVLDDQTVSFGCVGRSSWRITQVTCLVMCTHLIRMSNELGDDFYMLWSLLFTLQFWREENLKNTITTYGIRQSEAGLTFLIIIIEVSCYSYVSIISRHYDLRHAGCGMLPVNNYVKNVSYDTHTDFCWVLCSTEKKCLVFHTTTDTILLCNQWFTIPILSSSNNSGRRYWVVTGCTVLWLTHMAVLWPSFCTESWGLHDASNVLLYVFHLGI